jgi:DNA-directed RNA polymerase specialized sigma24 family protein
MSDVTRILSQIESGDPSAAAEQLLPLVYDELRKLAAAKLAHEKPGQTLQATALVHEAYLRLVGQPGVRGQGSGVSEDSGETNLTPDSCPLIPGFQSRGHFFAAAAEAMRRILVENARRKMRLKHGGGRQRLDVGEHDVPDQPAPEEVLALDGALTQLAQEDAVAAQVVHLHFFAGVSIEQAAEMLGISRATAYRQWNYARAWLRCAIGEDGNRPTAS